MGFPAGKWIAPLLLFLFGFVLVFSVKSIVSAKNTEDPNIISPVSSKTIQKITPTSTPTPTQTPTPTPTPAQLPTPTPTPVPFNLSEYLLSQVNQYRASQSLPPVQMDSNTCDFAKKRSIEISTNFNHDGFNSLPYPSYSKVTENIAQNSDYKNVVLWWINSSVHAENMRADTPFVCIQAYGDYYAYEGWKP